jgi:hypothetical protein
MRSFAIGVHLLVACGDVRIEPAPGGNEGGAPPITIGGAQSDGGAALAGAPAGGEGGGEPGPVPGCETLVWAGEPVSIPMWNAQAALLAPLDGGAVGLVYVGGNQGTSTELLSSRTIDGAFDAWPPVAINEPVVHVDGELVFGSSSLTSRPDGTFALVDYEPGIYRFGEPGVVLVNETYTYPFLAPGDDGAYFVEREVDGPLRFYKRSSLEPLGSVEELGEMPQPDFCSTAYAELSDTPTFLFASRGYCNDGTGDPWAQFYQPGPTQIQVATTMPLPFFPYSQILAPRPGGFWYAISAQFQTVVYRLTPVTTSIGEPIVIESDSLDPHKLALWRDGFALTTHTPEGLALLVSNGEQLTTSPAQSPSPIIGFDGPALLPGGTDDRSILIAVPGNEGITLLRADCVAD